MKVVLKNISKKFKNNIVLDDINLDLESGNIYGLSGRNGSGKTVLMKIMSGLFSPSTGSIFIDNEPLTINNNYKFNIGALLENPKFFPELTGFENLKTIAKIKNEINDEDILSALKIVNLLDEKDKKFGKYSLGMKQKLGVAQAIMENQKIILLDEPFSGIEERSVKELKEFIKEAKEQDKLIIISSHIKEDLDELCDKIFYLDAGKIN